MTLKVPKVRGRTARAPEIHQNCAEKGQGGATLKRAISYPVNVSRG